MNFKHTAPEWNNQGTEPGEDLRQGGFFAGYKPPASIFNWFWHCVSECIKEIQQILTDRTRVIISSTGEARLENNALYVIVSGTAEINAVAYDNAKMSEDEPSDGDNWLKTNAAKAVANSGRIAVQNGKLTVLKEPSSDTTFLNK